MNWTDPCYSLTPSRSQRPFHFLCTERNFFPSIVRSILGDMRRGREASPMRQRDRGEPFAPAKFAGAMEGWTVAFCSTLRSRGQTYLGPGLAITFSSPYA